MEQRENVQNIGNKENERKKYISTVSILIFINILMLVGIYRLIRIFVFEDSSLKTPYIDYAQSEIEYSDVNIASVRKILENKYNIQIHYGASTATYLTSVNAIAIEDKDDIYAMLNNVETELSKYPEALIDEIQAKGYKVVLHLVERFKNDNLALANRTTSGVFNIYISNSKEVNKAMHHETYHILEYYMKLEKDINEYYDSWVSYNPQGFEYAYTTKGLTGKYVHGYDKAKTCSFVTVYSKYSEAEDRAEVFSSMMIGNDEYTSPNILAKMENISLALDKTFVCVGADKINFWDRYIK